MKLALAVLVWLSAFLSLPTYACAEPASVCVKGGKDSFALIAGGRPASLLIEPAADPAVRHAANGFAADLERVSGQAPQRLQDESQARGNLIVVGVPGHSRAIDQLTRAGKLDISDIVGAWEAYRQIVVDRPYPNVPRALVIVGSDRRGAVYGMYDISEKMGVSPWYWFADVPVARRANVFVAAGSRRDQPRVKYRGFFINDENPSFGGWANRHYGGLNARMYEHVFELLLRLKGNYLWPAMWQPNAFNDDDPQNMILADEMGVVMGTSHHEPMTRAHDEWHRHTQGGVTGGEWSYATNAANLRAFWKGGIERMMSRGGGRPYESVVTLGMRGDGDEAMQEGTATQLLETIVADQRRIIEQVTQKPADRTPQVWALYKEVQDYYDHGMRVPDDVILLFADDNWGQIRRLPTGDLDRAGGFGVYYHFDYVGAPRNYKWLNTIQIEKTWQQMDLAYARGAKSLWIVNVGDIKPMEFPLSFFMKQAWDPQRMTLEALQRFPEEWARTTFGAVNAAAMGRLITRYSQYAARRKPELIDAGSFELGDGAGAVLDGGEFGAMIAEWTVLERDVRALKARLPQHQLAAYFQLVEHPIVALANLYRLYYFVAWNRRLASLNDPRANVFADRAEAAFRRDAQIAAEYHSLNGGKWEGMMAQTHIGYTHWQQPETQVMPEVERVAVPKSPPPLVFKSACGDVANPDAGVIAIEAPHFSRAVNGSGLSWRVIPNLGRTFGAVTAFPQGRGPTTQRDGVRLEYEVRMGRSGDYIADLYLVPTLNTAGDTSLQVGVSIDDAPMQTLAETLVPSPTAAPTQGQRDWNKAVEDNAQVLRVALPGVAAGTHVIKIWRLDDNVVLQKLVVSTGTVAPSYLGPSARYRRTARSLSCVVPPPVPVSSSLPESSSRRWPPAARTSSPSAIRARKG